MSAFEVHSGGDRRSLVKRFMGKSKQDAISQLVDIHLMHCTRTEKLEALLREALSEVPHGWGASFSESELAVKIRGSLTDEEPE